MEHGSPVLLHAATLVLVVFCVLAAIDGVYIHLFKLKLHTRPASRLEHALHSLRAVLAVPGLYALFAVVSGGRLLWLGIAVFVVDQVVEWFDQLSERASRAPLGGLGSFEYILHGTLSAARAAGFALSLAARPLSAFSLTSPNIIAAMPEPDASLVWAMLPGAVALALVHLGFAMRSRGATLAAA